MTKIIVHFTIAFVTLFTTAIASAEDDYTVCNRAETSEAEIGKAKKKFLEGTSAYKSGNYIGAIALWKEAYILDCTASLLLRHISRAYRELKEYPLALQALDAYTLHPQSTAPNEDQKILKEEREVILSHLPKQETVPVPEAPKQEAPKPVVNVISLPRANPKSDYPPIKFFKEHPVPLSLTAAGGTIMLVGGFLYLSGVGEKNRVDDQCPNRNCPTDSLTEQGNDARSRAKTGLVIGLLGTAIAATGATWLVMDLNKSSEKPAIARIQPWIGPKNGGITYQGTF